MITRSEEQWSPSIARVDGGVETSLDPRPIKIRIFNRRGFEARLPVGLYSGAAIQASVTDRFLLIRVKGHLLDPLPQVM